MVTDAVLWRTAAGLVFGGDFEQLRWSRSEHSFDEQFDEIVAVGLIGSGCWPRHRLNVLLGRLQPGGKLFVVECARPIDVVKTGGGKRISGLMQRVLCWPFGCKRLRLSAVDSGLMKAVFQDFAHQNPSFRQVGNYFIGTIVRQHASYLEYTRSDVFCESYWREYFRHAYREWDLEALDMGNSHNVAIADIDRLITELDRVAVISPHPDDELIGCGVLMLKAVQRNATVSVLQLTNGSSSAGLNGSSSKQRKVARYIEAEAVATYGGWHCDRGGMDDNLGKCHLSSAMAMARIGSYLDSFQPTIVVFPQNQDAHGDHRLVAACVNRLLADKVRFRSVKKVFKYNVWGFNAINCVINGDQEVPEVDRLLWKYDIALRMSDYHKMLVDVAMALGMRYMKKRVLLQGFWLELMSDADSEY